MTQRSTHKAMLHKQTGNTLVIVVVVLVVLALGAWLLMRDGNQIPAPDSDDPAVTSTAEPVEDTNAEPISGQRPGSEARQLIARLRKQTTPIDLHAVHVRGVEFLNQGKQVDAYLTWFFVARQGHAPSAFVLGEMYDPKYFNGANEVIDAADPAQAYKWYLQAAEAGDTTAEERLSDLMSRVETAAKAGNTAAARLLLRMQ